MLQLFLNLVLFCDCLTTRDYTCGIVVTVGWGEAGRAHSPLSLALVLVLPYSPGAFGLMMAKSEHSTSASGCR